MSERAPIALFVYRRPEHVARTLAALAECELATESDLYIFSDGPRDESDRAAVEATREVVKGSQGFRSVTLLAREANQGLANSIIAGVTQLTGEHGRVIVVEDDLIVAPGFLTYMNAALDTYIDDARVMQISGYMFPLPDCGFAESVPESFFLPFTTSWGWATWARAWKHFIHRADDALTVLQDGVTLSRFNLDGSYDYAKMLRAQILGEVDSWAIRFYWTVFSHDGLVLYPRSSLVCNEGFDGSGTHGAVGRGLMAASVAARVGSPSLARDVVVCQSAFELVKKVVAHSGGVSLSLRARTALASMMRRLGGRLR